MQLPTQISARLAALGVSLADVAARAGVTANAVYKHFDSKSALLVETARGGSEQGAALTAAGREVLRAVPVRLAAHDEAEAAVARAAAAEEKAAVLAAGTRTRRSCLRSRQFRLREPARAIATTTGA